MKYKLEEAVTILSKTPKLLHLLLEGLDEEWLKSNEGPDTWSPFDILGHLIHGENTDWIPRARIILSDRKDKTFEPFDRFAQFEISKDKTILELLDRFEDLRQANIEKLKSWDLTEEQLRLIGLHPELGEVTLKQLLATWMVHDLTHIRQIVSVMAKQQTENVGPWKEYLSILQN